MASPIIRIKRGLGKPIAWDTSSATGITSGEFAYDASKRVLYLGATGGYTGYDGVNFFGALYGDQTNPQTIPIGMQISNDPTFGNNTAIDVRAGYSNYTVPTTKAVKDYITAIQAQQALGVTLRPGAGIGLTYAVGGETADITITNLGTLKSYGKYYISGNSSGFSELIPGSTSDEITLSGGAGIKLTADKSAGTDTLKIQNIGVTSIGGYTGEIKDILPIINLSGYTLGTLRAVQSGLSKLSPIAIATNYSTGEIQISHEDSTVSSGTYTALNNSNKFQIPTISVDSKGHITGISQTELNANLYTIPGLTESVQDVVAHTLSSATTPGIALSYNDGSGVISISNTGVTGLGIFGGTDYLTGQAILRAGTGIGLAFSPTVEGAPPTYIQIENTANKFTNFTFALASTISGGNPAINTGGTIGANTTTLSADSVTDTINFFAGKGIGISAGARSLNDDSIVLWNTGIHTVSFLNSSGGSVASNLTGDLSLQAGSNIVFSNVGGNVISVSASSSGDGAGNIVADYTLEQGTTLIAEWGGSGVTGIIDLKGLNGILTRQTTSTNNGDLYIGLSSRLIVPPQAFIGYQSDYNWPGESITLPANIPALLKMPSTIETRETNDTWGGIAETTYASVNSFILQPNYITTENLNVSGTLPVGMNRIMTDSIISGLTSTVSYPNATVGAVSGHFLQPDNIDLGSNTVYPGKVLSLIAPGGKYVFGTANQTFDITAGTQAEIRLLGYPSAENLGSYLDEIVTAANSAACNDYVNGCVGFPPELPQCAIPIPGVGPISYSYTPEYSVASTDAAKPAIKMEGNVLLSDSILVGGDIWLRGNLLDAETGCLISTGNGNQGASSLECVYCFSDFGITATAVPNSIYVHGGTAAFNVDKFATTDNIIEIGGLSGGVPLSGNVGNRNNSDRGIIFHNRAITPATPLNATPAGAADKVSFIGIDQSTGKFTYIPTATVSTTSGVETVAGTPGPAEFSDINGVRIVNDTGTLSGAATFRVGPANSLTTDSSIIGKLRITSNSTGGSNTNEIRFNASAGQILQLGQNATSVDFVRGVTFNVGSSVRTYVPSPPAADANASHNLQLTWSRTNGTPPRTINFRNLGDDTYTQIIDVGRYSVGTNNATADLNTLSAGNIEESNPQKLWNKILAEGTVIDCGTY